MDIFRIRLCRDVGKGVAGGVIPGLMGSGDDGGSADAIRETGNTLYDRTKQTGGEASQYAGSFDIGEFLKQYFGYQSGMNAKPSGALSASDQFQQDNPLAQALYSQTLSEAQDPDKYYQSTLAPNLAQAQDTINTYYQKRGLLNSGLAIESMGRAGVDLSIKDAQARMAARQQSLQNAQAVNQNVYANNQQNLGNLANLYSTQQNAGLQSLSRQAAGATNAAGYQAAPATAQLGNYWGNVASQQALPGQIISAAGTVAAAGCWVAAEIFGGWYAPKTISARRYVATQAPQWFRDFYIKNGQSIANFISNKPIFKIVLRPLFELFAIYGGK